MVNAPASPDCDPPAIGSLGEPLSPLSEANPEESPGASPGGHSYGYDRYQPQIFVRNSKAILLFCVSLIYSEMLLSISWVLEPISKITFMNSKLLYFVWSFLGPMNFRMQKPVSFKSKASDELLAPGFQELHPNLRRLRAEYRYVWTACAAPTISIPRLWASAAWSDMVSLDELSIIKWMFFLIAQKSSNKSK